MKTTAPTEDGLRLIRNSERSDWKRCPWLWHEHWIKGWSPRREPTWAWFGSAIHKAMEARYPVGRARGSVEDMLAAFDEALDEQTRRIWTDPKNDLTDEEVVDGRELGRAMLLGYVETYGEDSEWEVIHTEQTFQVDVPDPDTGEVVAVAAGTWDALMRHIPTGEYWLWDHKTRKSFLSDWSYLLLNDQTGTYLWVAPEVLEHLKVFTGGEVIEGIIFNYLRKALPDRRPRNADGLATNKPKKEHYHAALDAAGYGYDKKATLATLEADAKHLGVAVYGDVSERQPAPLFHREQTYRGPHERVRQAERFIAEAKVMQQMLNGTLPIWKHPSEECPRCPLFEYCQLDESDPESAQEFAAGTMRFRDPYRDHREDFVRNGVGVSGQPASGTH